jgi:glycosyltransferase involved in cell wall biosynthesis
MKTQPWVSVICLCYNHEKFVTEAIQSVLNQTWPAIEFIVIDDASTDKSADVINEFCKTHPQIKFLPLKTNHGNCRAFNKGLAMAKGDFVIDLAADDVLLPTRIDEGVKSLNAHGDEYGVHFSDAEGVDKNGKHLWIHSKKIQLTSIPQGDVYKDLISRYFVCAPTIMCRKIVFDRLGGYDETLAFEDFDFWVRSARQFKYCYSDKVLVRKRILAGSKSSGQYRFGGAQMRSIFMVCIKIFNMNRTSEEMEALKGRVKYELRQAVRTLNLRLVRDYLSLLRSIDRWINQRISPNVSPIKPA